MARIIADSIDIPTAGSSVVISTIAEKVMTITFNASSGNTGNIVIGDSTVAAAIGFALAPGDALTLDPSQGIQDTGIPHTLILTDFKVDTATNGNDVEYVALVK